MRLLGSGAAHDPLNLLAKARVGPNVDHAVQRDAIGLQKLQDLHQWARLPGQVVGLVVLSDRELRRNQTIDQSTSLPVDLELIRGRIDQDNEFARVEVTHPRHRHDDPIRGVERGDTGSCDVQVQRDDGLIVDARAGFAQAGDVGQRQDAALLERGGLGGGLRAIVRQRKRDQHVCRGDEQADEEHPLEQAALSGGEIHDEEDWTDQAAAQQDHQLGLQVSRKHRACSSLGPVACQIRGEGPRSRRQQIR